MMLRSAPQTIRADGMDWPLQTYLDAMAFKRVDTYALPRFDGQARVIVVTADCAVSPPLYASDVRWEEAVAYRPLPGTPEAYPCDGCGRSCDNLHHSMCDDCYDAAEWDE